MLYFVFYFSASFKNITIWRPNLQVAPRIRNNFRSVQTELSLKINCRYNNADSAIELHRCQCFTKSHTVPMSYAFGHERSGTKINHVSPLSGAPNISEYLKKPLPSSPLTDNSKLHECCRLTSCIDRLSVLLFSLLFHLFAMQT